MTNAQLLQDAFGHIDEEIIDKAVNTYVSKRRSTWHAWVAAVAAVLAVIILLRSIPKAETVLDTGRYIIRVQEGEYAISSSHFLSGTGNDGGMASPIETVQFAGLSHMRQTLLTGKLSDRALRIMKRFKQSSYGGVLIFDPNNMYDITVPSDVQVDNLITWHGYGYTFNFRSDSLSGSLFYGCLDESQYYADREILKPNDRIEILSATQDPERNATITKYKILYDDSTGKKIVYSCTTGDKTITFVESYWYSAEQEIPSYITFWGTSDGAFFNGALSNFTERPSLEYLMQFGVTVFEGE